jgi:hypothetical protein
MPLSLALRYDTGRIDPATCLLPSAPRAGGPEAEESWRLHGRRGQDANVGGVPARPSASKSSSERSATASTDAMHPCPGS